MFSLFVNGRSLFAKAAVCTLSPCRRPVGRRRFLLPNRLKREQNLFKASLRLCCASRGEVQMELAEFYQFFYALAVSGLQTSAR